MSPRGLERDNIRRRVTADAAPSVDHAEEERDEAAQAGGGGERLLCIAARVRLQELRVVGVALVHHRQHELARVCEAVGLNLRGEGGQGSERLQGSGRRQGIGGRKRIRRRQGIGRRKGSERSQPKAGGLEVWAGADAVGRNPCGGEGGGRGVGW